MKKHKQLSDTGDKIPKLPDYMKNSQAMKDAPNVIKDIIEKLRNA